jgi:hypothetical protein
MKPDSCAGIYQTKVSITPSAHFAGTNTKVRWTKARPARILSPMSTIHLHQTATSTPEQFIPGLTDVGPGRSKLVGNSADEYPTVLTAEGDGQSAIAGRRLS